MGTGAGVGCRHRHSHYPAQPTKLAATREDSRVTATIGIIKPKRLATLGRKILPYQARETGNANQHLTHPHTHTRTHLRQSAAMCSRGAEEKDIFV